VNDPFHILSVVGARPNFMKVAPIAREIARRGLFRHTIVHTGQHYDARMSEVFFDELQIPRPDINLNVGSGSHAQQTAAVMAAFEPVLIQEKPNLVLVVGDVNSTLAAALVASKLHVRVAHVEAGLRSFDRAMPEEINRLLTDQLSDLLFVTEQSGLENLTREGMPPEKVHFVGNVMIDTLLGHSERARALEAWRTYDLTPKQYGLLTLHRPTNVDDVVALDGLFEGIEQIASDIPVLFPAHPRTQPVLRASRTASRLIDAGAVRVTNPLGYLEFLSLMDTSRVVLTDSGGIQEETTILGVPCLTLRTTTERPATIAMGTNRLVGTNPDAIKGAWEELKSTPAAASRVPPLWDGKAASRIVDVLADRSVLSCCP
jgi:UDP-N-acetylglucosamine 2-epimerase (non-hydrolysing)